MMVSFRSSYKQTAHDTLGYWPCIKHIDYSMGFTGESGGPNAVLKAFPAAKEIDSSMKRHHVKKSSTKCQLMAKLINGKYSYISASAIVTFHPLSYKGFVNLHL